MPTTGKVSAEKEEEKKKEEEDAESTRNDRRFLCAAAVLLSNDRHGRSRRQVRIVGYHTKCRQVNANRCASMHFFSIVCVEFIFIFFVARATSGPFESLSALPLGCDGKPWLPVVVNGTMIFVAWTSTVDCNSVAPSTGAMSTKKFIVNEEEEEAEEQTHRRNVSARAQRLLVSSFAGSTAADVVHCNCGRRRRRPVVRRDRVCDRCLSTKSKQVDERSR